MNHKASEKKSIQPQPDIRIGTTRDASGRTDLRYGIIPSKQPTKRTIVFLNGRAEWLEKYAYLQKDLNLPDDCSFLTFDHRGQGASGGARAYVDSYKSYALDAAKVIHEQVGDCPYAIIAHSMGGLISLYATLHEHIRPTHLVLGSPLLGMPEHPLPSTVARPLSRLLTIGGLGAVSTGAGSFMMAPFVNNKLTHNYERYQAMQNSPYKVPGATFSWVAASFHAISECMSPERLQKLTIPTLILAGSDETVVDPEGFRRFTQAALKHAAAPVTLRMIHEARHELFSEIPRLYSQVLGHVQLFLKDFLES